MGQPRFIDMYTDTLEPSLDALEKRGDTLDEDWTQTTGAIRAEEPAIGLRDPLATAFWTGYRPDAQVVRTRAGQLPAAYDRVVAAGRDGVNLYYTANGNAAAGMPR